MNIIANARTYTFKVTRTVGYVAYLICVCHCVAEYIVDFALCTGPSMEPTIHSKNIVLFEHMGIFQQKVNRGDIVITKSLSNPKVIICKRVKGIPGDRVFRETPYTIPKGHVWLEGDNKNHSLDSRIYGPIPQGLVKGKVLLVIWPFNNFKNLTKYTEQSN